MKEQSQFRDVFNRQSVTALANRIQEVHSVFNSKDFIESTIEDFDDLSLSERNMKICHGLKKYLPDDFTEAVKILLDSQEPEVEAEELEGTRGFIVMPQTVYVSEYGQDYFDLSMHALEEMTKRFTSEFAIRFFIIKHPERTLVQLKKWALDNNCHVRRLASEGSRPLLPWAMRLQEFVKDPGPVLEILELMKFSKERLVERSIANNLNDISKHNPELVTGLLKRWQKEGVSSWLITHALRTLFKQGNPDALKLNGFNPDVEISIEEFEVLTPIVEFGNHLEFKFEISSKASEKLMIDYIIHHMKANGKTAPKVFKLTKKTFSGIETINKTHSIRPISTRKYYPGTHILQIQINGRIVCESNFELRIS